MPITPAKAHMQRTQAAQMQSADTPVRADVNAYELMLVKLTEDKRRLHDIQSMDRRAEVKREILPDYAAWVAGAIEGGHGVQDDVLMTVMVWRIDVGDLAGALDIAAYAIEHKLAMPDRYKRSLGCVVGEEVADYALRKGDEGVSQAELACLIRANEITADEDMPDEVRAKLLKGIGIGQAMAAQHAEAKDKPALLTNAINTLKAALAKHEKVGVKKTIEGLERDLKNAEAEAAASGAGT